MRSGNIGSVSRRVTRSAAKLMTPEKQASLTPTKTPAVGQTPQTPMSLTDNTPSPQPSSRKRKASQLKSEDVSSQVEKETRPKKQKKEKAEKRERRFRAEPPQNFQAIYDRALSQRFYVLNRTRIGTQDCPMEDVEMTGSTGNIYTVHIGKRLRCTCPHHKLGGHQCKHILYVLKKVLNAPFDLVYQLALISTELQSIFASAPPISAPEQTESDKRKPIEGDCPICYCEFDVSKKESIVWCAAACGQNIHEACFRMWAQTKGGTGNVTCPMCRSVWKGDENMVAKIQKDKGQLKEGYVNVADQLGVSRVRDTSTYSRWLEYHQNGGHW